MTRSDAYTTEETARYLDADPLTVPEDEYARRPREWSRPIALAAIVGAVLLVLVAMFMKEWVQR